LNKKARRIARRVFFMPEVTGNGLSQAPSAGTDEYAPH
jgi:hypothetical protein